MVITAGRTVKRIISIVVFLGVGVGHAPVFAQAPDAEPRVPIRVLFIGNSATYVNNLPDMLEGLAKSTTGSPLILAEMVAKPAATLQQHWEEGQAVAKIRQRSWDYVVLQEQTSLGFTLIDGQISINDPRFFHTYARLFDREIKEAGAHTVFMLTWARKSLPEQQAALNTAHSKIADELGATLIPVGPAWQALSQQRPDLNLYMEDGGHPSPAGSYLAACLFYATLLGKSPLGLTGELSGHAFSVPGVRQDTVSTIAALSTSDAEALQRVAVQVRDELEAGTLLAAGGESALTLPKSLPTGRRPEAKDLIGIWSGPLKFYGQPANMELSVAQERAEWKVDWQVTLTNGSQRAFAKVSNFTVNGDQISFSVPDRKGPPEIYRGVLTGDSLVGTAEFGAPTHPPYLIGSWELKRKP